MESNVNYILVPCANLRSTIFELHLLCRNDQCSSCCLLSSFLSYCAPNLLPVLSSYFTRPEPHIGSISTSTSTSYTQLPAAIYAYTPISLQTQTEQNGHLSLSRRFLLQPAQKIQVRPCPTILCQLADDCSRLVFLGEQSGTQYANTQGAALILTNLNITS